MSGEIGDKMNQIRQWLSLICYGKVTKGFYKSNQKLFNETNWNTTRVLCAGGSLLCAYLGIMSILKHMNFGESSVLLAAAGASVVLYMLCSYRLKRDSSVVPIFYWLEFGILYVLFTYLEAARFWQSSSVFVFLLVAVSAVLYADMPFKMMITAGFLNLMFCVLSFYFGEKNPGVLWLDCQNGILIFLLSIVLMVYVRNLQCIHMQTKIRYQLQEGADSLTGLLKEEYTAAACQLYLEEKPAEELCVIMLIEVDDFQEIQEVYGKQMGEDALCTMGQILKGVFRERDILGRMADNKFLVCMKAVREEKIITKRASEIIARCHHQLHEIGIDNGSCSIGVCNSRLEDVDYKKVLDRASLALEEVKRNTQRETAQ